MVQQGIVEVVFASPEQQVIVEVSWTPGMTIEQAVKSTTLLEQFPEAELIAGRVGIFGERQPLDFAVQPGDRVELYRPLLMSPNDARMRRADRKKS